MTFKGFSGREMAELANVPVRAVDKAIEEKALAGVRSGAHGRRRTPPLHAAPYAAIIARLFAYGSNMDVAAMAARCPRSRLIGRGRLAGFRTILMPSGFVSVAPDRRMCVHGVLWDVAVGDVAALDRYEDVAHGLYAKKSFLILREPVGSVRALTYVGARPDFGTASPGYLEQIIVAARAHALPGGYIDHLSGLLSLHQSGRRR